MREAFLHELMILGSSRVSSDTSSPTRQTKDIRQVDITLSSESGTTGRTVSGSFIACDTNLTHVLLNDLKTPIGIQSSALLRLNDVIAISYC